MSFMDKARQAAEQARQAASQTISQVTSDESQAQIQKAAQSAGGGLRGAAGSAKRGMVTLVEKIDPGLLADIVIRATALQEHANDALRDKRSAYRIGELTITATIPPQIGFAITRISDEELDELRSSPVESSELVEAAETEDEVIVSLDGELAPAADDPAGG
ncbi:MAG TPA: hypothetical protein VGA26_00140 [Candidatus Limnocylindria bacterium]